MCIRDRPGICNVDTRSITNLIRENGAYKCLLNTKKNDKASLKSNLKLINEGERVGPFLFWGRKKLPVSHK